jgi:hypothetical protein
VFKENEKTWEVAPYFGLNYLRSRDWRRRNYAAAQFGQKEICCTNVASTSKRLGDVSAHAANAANIYSLYARANQMFSTNLSNTLPSMLMEFDDKTMDKAHKCGLGFGPEKPNDIEIHATLDPLFMPDVLRPSLSSKTKVDLAFGHQRINHSFLTQMANIGPQMINSKDTKGETTRVR